MSCHFLLQGILLTQRLNLHLLTGRLFTTETSEKPPRTMGNKLMRSDCGVQTRYNFWLQQSMCKCVSHFLPTGRVCLSDYQLEQNGTYCLGSEGKNTNEFLKIHDCHKEFLFLSLSSSLSVFHSHFLLSFLFLSFTFLYSLSLFISCSLSLSPFSIFS